MSHITKYLTFHTPITGRQVEDVFVWNSYPNDEYAYRGKVYKLLIPIPAELEEHDGELTATLQHADRTDRSGQGAPG